MLYGYGFDYTYILVLIGVGLAMWASAGLNSTYAKYSRIASSMNMTGADVARKMLADNGIYDVEVRHIAGSLTDNYNSRNKTVNLSDGIYNSTSVAAISVAAHECGHAVQDNIGYMPLRFRAALFPVANIGSTLAWPMILLGIFLGHTGGMFIQIGILLFMFAVLFQIVTLPVEYNASHRALVQLRDWSMLRQDEEVGARKVLNAAALTYLVAAISSILQLLRLLILFGGRRRRA